MVVVVVAVMVVVVVFVHPQRLLVDQSVKCRALADGTAEQTHWTVPRQYPTHTHPFKLYQHRMSLFRTPWTYTNHQETPRTRFLLESTRPGGGSALKQVLPARKGPFWAVTALFCLANPPEIHVSRRHVAHVRVCVCVSGWSHGHVTHQTPLFRSPYCACVRPLACVCRALRQNRLLQTFDAGGGRWRRQGRLWEERWVCGGGPSSGRPCLLCYPPSTCRTCRRTATCPGSRPWRTPPAPPDRTAR